MEPGALPTLEQWTDSITAVLDDLGSTEAVLLAIDGALATAALFAATYPSRTTALRRARRLRRCGRPHRVGWRGSCRCDGRHVGTGEFQHAMNPDMPWNEEIRAAWARHNRLAASPRTIALMLPLVIESSVRAILPTVRVPTLVVQHADDPFATPAMGKDVADHIPGAKYVEVGRNISISWNRGANPFRRSPSSSPASRLTWPMIGCWPRCCSPTSWTRRAGRRRSATGTGTPCLTRTMPSSGRSSGAFEAAR